MEINYERRGPRDNVRTGLTARLFYYCSLQTSQMAEEWLGNNVDKAQDKDRDKVRKISINGQRKERLEIRRATDRTCERRVYRARIFKHLWSQGIDSKE